MSEGSVNSQIVDSVASVVTLTGGNAPAQAFAMLDTVMIETLGMAMYNAVSRQQGASMIGSAAVTATCARMLGTPFAIGPVPPSPPTPPPPPHGVQPLGPTPKSPEQVIAEARADAKDALGRMTEEGKAAGANVTAVADALKRFATGASADALAVSPTPAPTGPVTALYTAPAPTDPAPVPPCPPAPSATETTTHAEMSVTSKTFPMADDAASPTNPVPR